MNSNTRQVTDSQELEQNFGNDGAPRINIDDAFPSANQKEVTQALDPTRYGDWEVKGRCIDF